MRITLSPFVEGFGVTVMDVMEGSSSALLLPREIFLGRDVLPSRIFVKLLSTLPHDFESGVIRLTFLLM